MAAHKSKFAFLLTLCTSFKNCERMKLHMFLKIFSKLSNVLSCDTLGDLNCSEKHAKLCSSSISSSESLPSSTCVSHTPILESKSLHVTYNAQNVRETFTVCLPDVIDCHFKKVIKPTHRSLE